MVILTKLKFIDNPNNIAKHERLYDLPKIGNVNDHNVIRLNLAKFVL